MKDIEIVLDNRPGQLALIGETLGKVDISLEGGGVFTVGTQAIAHFLIEEAERAKKELLNVGINVIGSYDVIILKLRQEIPGQLGAFCNKLADAGINIITQYSDHDNQLIVVVDNYPHAMQIREDWMKEWWT